MPADLYAGNHAGTSAGIVFLGDSITSEGNWSELFPGTNVKNEGVWGETTSDIINRLSAVITNNPKKIFVLSGINDLATGVSPRDVAGNYSKMIKELTSKLPQTRIYVQSILPVAGNNGMINDLIISSNESLKNTIEKLNNKRVKYIDI
ncbi:MAG: hypothetical protein HQK89_10480, partial [Nitrospirae bacterium]|nr:hypothetical protein [Nitrospirota bacterium]